MLSGLAGGDFELTFCEVSQQRSGCRPCFPARNEIAFSQAVTATEEIVAKNYESTMSLEPPYRVSKAGGGEPGMMYLDEFVRSSCIHFFNSSFPLGS